MIAAGLALEPDPPTAVPSCATSAEMVIPRLSCSKPHTMALAYRFYKAATVSSSKVAWWRVRPSGFWHDFSDSRREKAVHSVMTYGKLVAGVEKGDFANRPQSNRRICWWGVSLPSRRLLVGRGEMIGNSDL
jgi:hypothetical protein